MTNYPGYFAMKTFSSGVLVGGILACLCGCVQKPFPITGVNHPLSKVVLDTKPTMPFAPAGSYDLAFGRGGTWHGYDTIVLKPGGLTRLHRMRSDGRTWETTTMQLDDKARLEIGAAIRDLGLLKMAKAYHADVYDGTQWIFWLRQYGWSKRIYLDNHAPDEMKRFANLLDEILEHQGPDGKRWSVVPESQARNHEKILWLNYDD